MSASWDIFLAHAAADASRADALWQRLARRHRVFLDARSIRPGEDWDLAIADALRAARVIAVVVPARIDVAWYLRDEIATAIALSRSGDGARRVIALLPDGPPAAGALPYGLAIVDALDARALGGLDGIAAALDALLSAPARRP